MSGGENVRLPFIKGIVPRLTNIVHSVTIFQCYCIDIGYQDEKGGGGGKCPPIVFLEGANIHHYAFVEGAIILPCQLLGGQMSTHAIFHRGADVRGRKCPAPRNFNCP